LTAWQKEGYLMFEHLLSAVDNDYVRYITHVDAAPPPASEEDEGLEGALTNADQVAPGATELPAHGAAAGIAAAGIATAESKPAPVREKLGRNDPCWCGSKRKFKQCHGRP
jgi:preprotein translocase subunit SecA